ncbi:NAD(P)H-binding protein [Helcobacillus massiliensis]|uniref:NAD-dependent epimerase/dehydratase family protein n=1 Tax=Helcobacillus TaxID=1161125 RepID=UPI001EF7165A|nr:NAD-dependent epimerase/dehydratase family protein [Helcobacillus massiliensis]MCG7427713.1 NAD(P)H-binding protein [Helcobacillus sp. ACRRO]MCT1557406.1 NAD(P)H-binding protein [Helcobacillus massiliensis]MCT2036871.1 NAD(P)H-binding protein [Helcobacillus massiliensis]MCT2331691.1 NAD(P)H-binding protein [Helcobacillus massiliensis]MDK7742884.1 NAD(P)H-binding protein [Helcobacillus massiliensis]
MRIAVTGATGVLGQEAVEALVAEGHEVTGVTRRERGIPIIEGRGARPVVADVFSASDLARAFRGHDVVINTLAKIPVGMTALRPLAWREDDRLHQEASVAIAQAAADAGCSKLIQESSLFMYPDNGDDWIGEDQALNVRSSAFRARVTEMRAAVDFANRGRSAVILRLGQLYGRDPATTDTLRKVRDGAPVLLGKPSDYITLLHHQDAGRAFTAALKARSGFYNVGGEPIRRERWAKDLGREAKADKPARFFNDIAQLALSPRLEVQRRSLRVSSLRFFNETGWTPTIGPSTLGWSRM